MGLAAHANQNYGSVYPKTQTQHFFGILNDHFSVDFFFNSETICEALANSLFRGYQSDRWMLLAHPEYKRISTFSRTVYGWGEFTRHLLVTT